MLTNREKNSIIATQNGRTGIQQLAGRQERDEKLRANELRVLGS